MKPYRIVPTKDGRFMPQKRGVWFLWWDMLDEPTKLWRHASLIIEAEQPNFYRHSPPPSIHDR